MKLISSIVMILLCLINLTRNSALVNHSSNVQSLQQFKGKIRLPKFAVPKRYELFLKPDLEGFNYTGTVKITINVVQDTHFLVLNAVNLTVMAKTLWFQGYASSDKFKPVEITMDELDQILVLGFNNMLPLGQGDLYIEFNGILNDQSKGFYKSVHEHNGKDRYMAMTQFALIDARRCFPCWDEPAFKATFNITLEIPFDLIALSNMPIIKEEVDVDFKKVYFEESPNMSTYLVAVVVGLFDYIEAFTSDGIKVRFYNPFNKTYQGNFALELSVKSLEFYKEYFMVPYPLPKLDMIILPQFSYYGMENYGLITFNKDLFSYESNSTRTANVVAHEVAHQWLGNLVTMEWWTHLWLNEGFSNWACHMAIDFLFPELEIMNRKLQLKSQVLKYDSGLYSHPIEVTIKHMIDFERYLDSIPYNKGSSLMEMMESFLGSKTFQKSMALYVRRFAYSNANTNDLWNVLEEVSNKPIKEIMTAWTKNIGYPIVTVNLRNEILDLKQSIFLSSGFAGVGEWIIPISLCYGSCDNIIQFFLKQKSEKFNLSQLIGSSIDNNKAKDKQVWIKLNVNWTGYYRVKYEDELEYGIKYAVENKKVSASDRFEILDDSYEIYVASKKNLSSMLFLMQAYREEYEGIIIEKLTNVIKKVRDLIADAIPELLDEIMQFQSSLLQYSIKEVLLHKKYQGIIEDEISVRELVLKSLVRLGDSSTIDEGLKNFNTFFNHRNTTFFGPADRSVLYYIAIRSTNKTNRFGYDALLKLYRETELIEDKQEILKSLVSSPDPDIVLEALNFIISSEVPNKYAYLVSYGVEIEGREIAWKWFKGNWDYLNQSLEFNNIINEFIDLVLTQFSSYEMANEIETFFASRLTPTIFESYKIDFEQVRENAKLVRSIREEKSSITRFIKNYV